jgi:hypothetical protein
MEGYLMSSDHLLAIDCGTQSIRALLFDLRGVLLAKQRVPTEPYFSDASGLAEQHPHVFWDVLCQACHGLWQHSEVPKDSIAGLALTTQRSTVINPTIHLLADFSHNLAVGWAWNYVDQENQSRGFHHCRYYTNNMAKSQMNKTRDHEGF